MKLNVSIENTGEIFDYLEPLYAFIWDS